MMNPRQETLAAAISCTQCGNSHVVATTAAFLAAIPGWNGNTAGPCVATTPTGTARSRCPRWTPNGVARSVPFPPTPELGIFWAITSGRASCGAGAGSRWIYATPERAA